MKVLATLMLTLLALQLGQALSIQSDFLSLDGFLGILLTLPAFYFIIAGIADFYGEKI